MIEINLLPPELRVKIKEKKPAIELQQPNLIYGIPAALAAVCLLVTVYIVVVAQVKKNAVDSLTRQWDQLETQRKRVDDTRQKYTALSHDAEVVQKLVTRRINWAPKLNSLSRNLSAGIWFTDISVSPRDFSLQGTVISLKNDEMALIREFVDKLHKDGMFIRDFASLELGAVKKRLIAQYEVADFTLSGKFKPE